MQEKPLGFMQFKVIYIREGVSNKWTRRTERITDPKKFTNGVSFFTVLWEGEKEKDEKHVAMVNVKCDPLFNDPNTFTVPEDWQPHEEEALELTDKEFKKLSFQVL